MYGAFDILYLALFTAAVIKTPQNIVKICNISFYELFAVFIEWQNLYSILYIMPPSSQCPVGNAKSLCNIIPAKSAHFLQCLKLLLSYNDPWPSL